ncbi:hypothetical protein AL755_19215 [Arthrobacter sp. ERGS1:01]|uniref:hypothetical protein n=1 Tax=Arthrobacter sp. ERGS1:01 TaxID=1704044 RepID=UPI0006B4F8B8|nr:hypothetical protein [Arthrobacter sp. ERGS1:01]ALE07103.1 hypothetical protein AL755_19215 [Arthrobacter sp. ERGS1:01]
MKIAGHESWQMGEDASWHLTAALYIRDALGLPATKPFFIPPVRPSIPEHIPVTGPELDILLAGEWALWFSDLLADHVDWGTDQPLNGTVLERRSQAFQQAVADHAEAAGEAASTFRDSYGRHFQANFKSEGPVINRLVRSVEKERGHRAAPFELQLRILPVEGIWLHRVNPQLVLLSEVTRRDPGSLKNLLGPVITELAR